MSDPHSFARPAGILRYCAFLAFAATLATGQLFGYIELMDPLKEDFGGGAVLGLPLFASGYALGMLLIGSMSGRWGARRVLVISLAAGGVMSALCAFAPSLVFLTACRLIGGIALGGFPPAAFTASLARVPPAKILFANSAMVFGLLGSAGVMGLFSWRLAPALGWRGVLMAYALLLMIAAFAGSRVRGLEPAKRAMAHPYRDVWEEARTGDMGFSAGVGVMIMATFVAANALSRQGEFGVVSLVVVCVIVLTVLACARQLIRWRAEIRRCLGLGLALSAAVVLLLGSEFLVLALMLITAGAAVAVPASIQLVVGSARGSAAAAVAVFTCSLFVGGALSGFALTGLIPVEVGVVAVVLTASLTALLIAAAVFRLSPARTRLPDGSSR